MHPRYSGTDKVYVFLANEDGKLGFSTTPDGKFEIKDGRFLDIDTGNYEEYNDGVKSVYGDIKFLDFSAEGNPTGGVIELTKFEDGYGVSLDAYTQGQLYAGNRDVSASLTNYFVENGIYYADAVLPQEHVSIFERFNITRQRVADYADDLIDEMTAFLLPEALSLDLVAPGYFTAVQVANMTAKGYVDSIGRLFTSGEIMADDFTEMQEAWDNGDLTGAAKNWFMFNAHGAVEVMRLVEVGMMFGGVMMSAPVQAAKQTVQSSKMVPSFVKGLLNRTDDLAASMLTKLFANPSLKAKFITNTDDINDVAKVVKKGFVNVDETVPIIREADEVNKLMKAEYVKRGGDPTKFYNPYKAGAKVSEKLTKPSNVFLRAFQEGKSLPDGKWMIREADLFKYAEDGTKLYKDGVPLLKNDKIANKANIASFLGIDEPTHVVKASGLDTIMFREGPASEVSLLNAAGGAKQVQVLQDVAEDWFHSIKTLEDFLNG